ncbi:MAG: methyl-accepting chemotaxis protein, partial [Pseudomonadota bacterium]|nr:methyl-accepting chemotaxis protein [Pseudomonadota bacterium]
MNILKQMKLRTKLIVGFSIVLLLLIVVSLVGYIALNTAASGFTDYREMARDNNLSGRLQANMLMVRMNVKDFIITGSEKDKKQYQDYYTKMNGFLQTAKKEIQNPARAKKIDFIEEVVVEYDKGFKAITEIKKQRNHIVYDILGKNGKLMEQELTEIMTSAEKDQDFEAAFQTGLALRNLLLSRLYVVKFLDSNDQKDADRVNAEFDEMESYLIKLKENLQNPERQKLLHKMIENNNEYRNNFKTLVQLIFARNKIITNTLDRIGPEIAGAAEDVKLDIKRVQDEIGPRLHASNNQAVTLILLLAILALVSGIAIIFLITRNVLKQLGGDPSQIADVAKSIADGNLKIEFKTQGKKRIEGVYKDMEVMSKNLRRIFTDIAGGAEQIADSAHELLENSKAMSHGAEQTADKSNLVAAASEEMSTNMNTVAAAMEETTTNTNMVASSSEEMSSTISEISENTSRVDQAVRNSVTQAQNASERVAELEKSAFEINKVTEVISGISSQTNLLALNATIEAARAGEAGKGFAVVASEIKALAGQTAAATEEITKEINAVQQSTQVTTKDIREIGTTINEVSEMITTISAAVEEQSVTTREMAGSVAQT